MPGPWEQFQGSPAGDAKPWEQFQKNESQPKPFGQQMNEAVRDVPRQLGLTARYAAEGVGGIMDFVSSPIRGALNLALPDSAQIQPGSGQSLADAIGLPQPATPQERIIGDAARTVAGGMVPIGVGRALASGATGVTQGVGRMLASNPGGQLASAGSAGAAGAYTRETGGDSASQMLASLAAGVAAPMAIGGAAGAARSMMTRPAPTPAQIEITINNAMQPSGMTMAQLPGDVAAGIRNDVSAAMRIGGNLSPDAIRRLADYRLTGLTPSAAGLTLDPAIVTQQRNLAKLGINSKDQAAQQLGQMANANNRGLTAGLNKLGANTTDDAIAGAGRVIGALDARDAKAKKIIGSLYDKARDSSGRSASLDPYAFTQRAGNLLNKDNVESFLTPDIRNKLNGFASGKIPLTVEIAEQLKTSIGSIQRKTTEGNTRYALGLVRQALDETPLLNPVAGPMTVNGGNQLMVRGGNQIAIPSNQLGNVGQEAMDAFSKARRMNRAWMGVVEKTPALEAVREGIEPDKFVQQFIVGSGPKSNVMDVAMLKKSIKGSPSAIGAVKEQIAAYLKNRALNGADDEVGNFSQSSYNKALSAIGDRKLNLFFSPTEVNQMHAIGRVASYEQFQPVGSAVNNSNTASAGLAAVLDRIGSSSILSKIPLGKLAAEPIQNIAVGMRSAQSLNVPRALTDGVLQRQPPMLPNGMLMSPAAFMGETDEEQRQRKLRELLFPVP